jgi:hypothetical protein
VFDLRDKPAALPEPKRHKVEDLAAEQRRRDDAKAKIATKIEDELAELKKRLGK